MNMLVAEDGTIKIADFGLSKVKEETDQQEDGAMSAGSMPWMAPELMGDSNPSPKADIFSFYVLTVCEIFSLSSLTLYDYLYLYSLRLKTL